MLIVSFLRHGSTSWNEQGRMQGRRDIPLSASGRDEVGRWRLPFDAGPSAAWMSSPLSRAVATARPLCGDTQRLEPALIEMDWGEWEGSRLQDLRTRHGEAFTNAERRGLDFRPPGGESPRDVVGRVLRWLDAVSYHDRPLVGVTHNGVLRALLSIATGWDMTDEPPVELAPASVHRFALARGPKLSILECNLPLSG